MGARSETIDFDLSRTALLEMLFGSVADSFAIGNGPGWPDLAVGTAKPAHKITITGTKYLIMTGQ